MDLEEYNSTQQQDLGMIRFDDCSIYDCQQLCEYLGENIYRVPVREGNTVYGYAVLNMDSKSVISTNIYSENIAHIEHFITGFENGSATILYNAAVDSGNIEDEDTDIYWDMPRTNRYSLCHMKLDGTITPIVSNSWTNDVLPKIMSNENEFHDGLLFVPYKGVCYDINGNVAIEFSEYNGKKQYFCDPFYNGYALMLIEGADQFTYFTVIDKSGKTQFEPKSGFDNAYMSKDGKFVIAVTWQNLTVFDIGGNALASVISEQISADDGLYKRNASIPWQNKYDVCDGVIKFNNFFVNVKEKTLIGSAYGADVDFQQ